MCQRGQQIPLGAQALSHHQLSPQNICRRPRASGHCPCCPALAAHACPCPKTREQVLTRVPVSALSVYDELKNLTLVFGSTGISSLFLNHWYWDLGNPSSSKQLSSADFPKGTDFGTLHFGTTGFTAVTENI